MQPELSSVAGFKLSQAEFVFFPTDEWLSSNRRFPEFHRLTSIYFATIGSGPFSPTFGGAGVEYATTTVVLHVRTKGNQIGGMQAHGVWQIVPWGTDQQVWFTYRQRRTLLSLSNAT